MRRINHALRVGLPSPDERRAVLDFCAESLTDLTQENTACC